MSLLIRRQTFTASISFSILSLSFREVIVLPLHQSQLVISPLQLLTICEGCTGLLKLTQCQLHLKTSGIWLRMGEWWFVC